jgi:hypothetical protein
MVRVALVHVSCWCRVLLRLRKPLNEDFLHWTRTKKKVTIIKVAACSFLLKSLILHIKIDANAKKNMVHISTLTVKFLSSPWRDLISLALLRCRCE